MVGFKNMGSLMGGEIFCEENKKKLCLGILSFETAKIMSRLVSLYKSLSDEEVLRLKNDVIKSEGISVLNSREEEYLLNLACAEMLEELDRAASAVRRLGKKCNYFGLNRFDLFYMNLKNGILDFQKFEYGSRGNKKRLRKMGRLITATCRLRAEFDALAELEISEWKMKQLNLKNKKNCVDDQRKIVRRFSKISLWSKSFDEVVGLMARIVCIVYVKICSVFGPNVTLLSEKEQFVSYSGPIAKTSEPTLVRFYSRKSDLFLDENVSKRNGVFHAAGASTLGGLGLALHYANVILLAEKYLDKTEKLGHTDRDSLYRMLPKNMKILVKMKLSKNMKRAGEADVMLAEGWRDAMMDMLRWLGPMAQNTVNWHMEKSFEKMKLDSKPLVFLFQTLHFSDKEKTEAAIAELLVGLSCICKYENRKMCV